MSHRVAKVALVCCLGLASCQGLEGWQLAELQRMENAGLPKLEPKAPAVAGVLNLVIGMGDVYNGEWGAFVVDLLFWPASVLWAVPQGVITASNINNQKTWAYYKHGPGRAEWAEHESVNATE